MPACGDRRRTCCPGGDRGRGADPGWQLIWRRLLLLGLSPLGLWLLRREGARAWRVFQRGVPGRPAGGQRGHRRPARPARRVLLVILRVPDRPRRRGAADTAGPPDGPGGAAHRFGDRLSPDLATSLFGPLRVGPGPAVHNSRSDSRPARLRPTWAGPSNRSPTARRSRARSSTPAESPGLCAHERPPRPGPGGRRGTTSGGATATGANLFQPLVEDVVQFGHVRRSRSMSQWVRGGLAFFCSGSLPSTRRATVPSNLHSQVIGTSASTANGTSNDGPLHTGTRESVGGPARCCGQTRS